MGITAPPGTPLNSGSQERLPELGVELESANFCEGSDYEYYRLCQRKYLSSVLLSGHKQNK